MGRGIPTIASTERAAGGALKAGLKRERRMRCGGGGRSARGSLADLDTCEGCIEPSYKCQIAHKPYICKDGYTHLPHRPRRQPW